MFVRKNQQSVTYMENAFGGKGKIESRNFLEIADAAGSGRKFAVNTIQPGDSLGYHAHNGEFEVYYILEGTAKIVEDGQEYLLYKGDMMQCKSGSSHSIENVGTTPLEHLALIIYNRD